MKAPWGLFGPLWLQGVFMGSPCGTHEALHGVPKGSPWGPLGHTWGILSHVAMGNCMGLPWGSKSDFMGSPCGPHGELHGWAHVAPGGLHGELHGVTLGNCMGPHMRTPWGTHEAPHVVPM